MAVGKSGTPLVGIQVDRHGDAHVGYWHWGCQKAVQWPHNTDVHWVVTETDLIDNLQFPATAKAGKLRKPDETPAKGSLFSGKMDSSLNDAPGQPQHQVDLNFSAKLFPALRKLRTDLVTEAGEGVMAYHIFGNATLQHISRRVPRTREELLEISGIGKAKVKKYGDRVLETIESFIKEYYKTDKSSSGGNDSCEVAKRRRDSTGMLSSEDDDFIDSNGVSKKRATKDGMNTKEPKNDYVCIDDDLDWDECENDMDVKASGNESGRLLPPWSTRGNKGDVQGRNLFKEYAFKG